MQRTIGLVHVRGSDYVSLKSGESSVPVGEMWRFDALPITFRQVSGKLANEEIGKRGWIPSAERLTCFHQLKTGVAKLPNTKRSGLALSCSVPLCSGLLKEESRQLTWLLLAIRVSRHPMQMRKVCLEFFVSSGRVDAVVCRTPVCLHDS